MYNIPALKLVLKWILAVLKEQIACCLLQQRMHSTKVGLATPAYARDAESVYGSLHAQMEELQQVDPLVR